jgi:hypothetical protein
MYRMFISMNDLPLTMKKKSDPEILQNEHDKADHLIEDHDQLQHLL